MRITLASYLMQAVHDIKQFKDGPIDPSSFLNVCDKYQVNRNLMHLKHIYIGRFRMFSLFAYYIGNCIFQAQIVVLAAQILWSEDVEFALHAIANGTNSNESKMAPLEHVLHQVENMLNILADSVLQEQPLLRRKKLEHLVG